MIECEVSQTCTLQGSSDDSSLYVVNDGEFGPITTNVTISGMVFTGYTGEDSVGVFVDELSGAHFRDCVFTVSYCVCSVIVPCFNFYSQAIQK